MSHTESLKGVRFSVSHGYMGRCLGCGRTRNECDKWKKLRPYDIKIIQKQVEKHLKLDRVEAAIPDEDNKNLYFMLS